MDMVPFQNRRQQLLNQLPENSIAVLPAAQRQRRNGDVDHMFRQDSNFWYLTGFDEPDAVAVLLPGDPSGSYRLFCKPYDAKAVLWDGPMVGLEGAKTQYGADQAYPIDELDAYLEIWLHNKHTLYYPTNRYQTWGNRIHAWLEKARSKTKQGISVPTVISDLNVMLDHMRLIKSPEELTLMRKAAEISANAHVRLMQNIRPGMYEYELQAALLHDFYADGCRFPAYDCIVGSGLNSCMLHYQLNRDKMKDGDLVLVDAGAEYQFYAADITRTSPVNGCFTSEQAAIYDVVLQAQLSAIDIVKPGIDWAMMHQVSIRVIAEGLIDLGLLDGNLEDVLEQKSYTKFFPHRTGHWLGMDVHDVGVYQVDGQWQILKPRMTFTIEPGIYIPASLTDVHERWHGIGVRIEDDVCVSEAGCEVLSHQAPKLRQDVEHLMSGV